MFLDATLKHNRNLIDASIRLHQQGLISPDTYVIDLDMVQKNAQALAREAKKQDIELFFMTKQIGRNTLVARTIVEAGIEKAVAVDPWEALTLYKHGIKIGHVGHLVQIPKHMIRELLDLDPDYVTVFSYENAQNISNVALGMGKKQKIFLRIADTEDYIYDGQKGGFTLKKLGQEIDLLMQLRGVEIAGLTSFPCILIAEGEAKVTPNVTSMQKARELLEKKGYQNLEMNMPSATSTATMKLLKENEATQGEPGHALTGTTPLHASGDYPEKPAMVYVSEVAHLYENKAHVFGGGFYPRSRMEGALVASDKGDIKRVPVIKNDPTNIDYYGTLDTDKVTVGDTVLYAFRTQIFVTNARLAVVRNLDKDPVLLGIYDSTGNLIR
ncbi:YhfX family PLP-dependent enzyme [Lentibacillus sp. L22]|uniref:YhfX family PLP-dependent enzyme n=1 Tax=Lentibacillus sp. L22 TaxID=3163028 RepID=UPI003466A4E9